MNNAPNMHVGTVKRNHSGHEMFDIHEVLSVTVSTLDQYTMSRQYVKCSELLTILDRQYQFLTDEYNMLVQAFSTGEDPAHGTLRYQMTEHNDTIVYGMKPSQPKKPIHSMLEVKDEGISGHMLIMLKTLAGIRTVAATEATNPVVRRVLADSIPNCIEMAYEIFLYQNKNNFYQVPQLAEQDMVMMQNSFGLATNQPQVPRQPQDSPQTSKVIPMNPSSPSNPMIHRSH
ncbi:spore coat protein [Baia soyae]|uniref:Spore coat protein CotF n=1 Tax=Baia soyae TaxID=1544746 RepID=A0A4R2S418_9BACL|nr:spore coat protein [Baia soyae]TCP70432.1 spore coat protein CotF [Baia soyae]